MSNIIAERRKELGLTMKELSEMVNVSEATISRWESGNIANMRRDRISALSVALKVSPIEIMNGERSSHKTSKSIKIPVLGYVKAGIPIEAVEEILDYEEISPATAAQGEYFGLRIKGDSMEPRMLEGDVVIVRKQSTVENGDIAVVLVNGDEATVKKFYRTSAGIKLVSANSKYDPFFFTADEVNSLPVSIVGKVVELRAKF